MCGARDRGARRDEVLHRCALNLYNSLREFLAYFVFLPFHRLTWLQKVASPSRSRNERPLTRTFADDSQRSTFILLLSCNKSSVRTYLSFRRVIERERGTKLRLRTREKRRGGTCEGREDYNERTKRNTTTSKQTNTKNTDSVKGTIIRSSASAFYASRALARHLNSPINLEPSYSSSVAGSSCSSSFSFSAAVFFLLVVFVIVFFFFPSSSSSLLVVAFSFLLFVVVVVDFFFFFVSSCSDSSASVDCWLFLGFSSETYTTLSLISFHASERRLEEGKRKRGTNFPKFTNLCQTITGSLVRFTFFVLVVHLLLSRVER